MKKSHTHTHTHTHRHTHTRTHTHTHTPTHNHTPTQEYAGADTAGLYLEESDAQLRLAAENKRKKQLAVPGIINPHDRPDEMQE